ncbi:MAG: hypothetical protein CVV16_04920 [Gammaproteobacteria bacterium HGW-Gammaproteobacteria-6]|nr:MAG: hypothetical protein CVV16_04920 [Gammaproteobacteria bacterium HGW-Gammaproteobacteria-6]
MNQKDQFSIINGMSFAFDDDGNKIVAWFSSLTGLEKIYVNGSLVSSQRNISRRSINEFKIGENLYSVNMEAVTLLKGPFVCTLLKNGIDLKRKKVSFANPSTLSRLAIFIMAGLFLGYINSIFAPPKAIFYLVLLAVFIGIVIFGVKNGKSTIEEENLF